jgi:hypothetical protein
MLFYQLTHPLSYLFIKDSSKWKIDWLIPFIIALLLSGGYDLLPHKEAWYNEKGIIKELQGLLQILPGFYLTALAAITTFNKKDLDYYLPKPTPKINILVNGHRILINLTRRKMLSYLFGYLTLLSLMLYISTVLGSAIAPSFHEIFGHYPELLSMSFTVLFQLFFWQMIVITIFGLYQLCDRIHQPDNDQSKIIHP